MGENLDLASYLIDFIKKEVQKEIKNLKFVNSYSGTVVSVGTTTLNVRLAGSDTVLTDLKNKSNVAVNVNDEVVVVVLKNDLTNCFVAWKK